MTTDLDRAGFTYYGKTPSGVEMALALPVSADMSPAGIAQHLAELDAELRKVGFVRSDRLDKPAYGGGNGWNKGNQPQETLPPANLVVHEHCGQPMKYVIERPATADKDIVAAHWDCRRGRSCEEGRKVGDRVYPFTNWHLTPKDAAETAPPRAQGGAGTVEKASAAQPSDAPESFPWAALWKAGKPLGLTTQSQLEELCRSLGFTKATMGDDERRQIIAAAKRSNAAAA